MNLNEVADDIIGQLDDYVIKTGLDPIEIEDIHEGFEFVSSKF